MVHGPLDRSNGERLRASQGSNLDRLRAHNLSVILTRLHHDGPSSRSSLASATGLNRSTVTILINELIQRGLAVESVPVESAGTKKSVGRPRVDVDVSERVFAIAVNPEIDAITVAVVGLGGKVRRVIRYDTGSTGTMRETVAIVAVIIEGILSMLPSDALVVGVGVAVRKQVDHDHAGLPVRPGPGEAPVKGRAAA